MALRLLMLDVLGAADSQGMNGLATAAARPSGTSGRSPALRLVGGAADTAVALAEPAFECGSRTLRLLPTRQLPTALVADSDERILSMLSYHLGRDFDILPAHDGEEALRLALVEQPDLILLDVRMPKLDGYEVTRQIRRNVYTCDIPVILLDPHPERIDTLRGLAAGADDYIVKPFDSNELLARIQSILGSEPRD
jgi:CheY-like chemotaxis protein